MTDSHRCVITGLRGTLAPHFAAAFSACGYEIIGWNREFVPPEDKPRCNSWLEEIRPDAICHLAQGSETWGAVLAAHAHRQSIPFLFTSSAMVFHHDPDGPHRPDDARTARDEYGLYKIRCEDLIRRENPRSIIVRIGWQIDSNARGNNMMAHLDRQQKESGCIGASRNWIPACSFMEDTASACRQLMENAQAGIYHLDSNAGDRWSFDRIVGGLKKKYTRDEWVIVPNEDYRHDQRLVGHEQLMPLISARLI